MAWTRFETFAVSDDGAAIIRTDGGWEALPFGPEGGTVGVFASAEDAMAVADAVRTQAHCCSDLGGDAP